MSDLIGQVFAGRYEVRRFLGRGGMAEVFQVLDRERMVELALKLLHADLAQDVVFLRRFKREAETLASLQHPNIVRFYGLEKDGINAFILMDYVDGTSLRTEIARQAGLPFSPQRILEILRPVCAALHYAHRQGFVHCDVKPANIMLHKNGTVLVADFGIARMTENATTTTMVGAGTPAYMAPEVVKGLDPTPQTDIYAIGIVLYEMLTGGERPFTGERATTTGSTMEKVRWEQVNSVPLSPRQYNPAISPALENVILKCLEKDPARRFNSTLEVAAALQYAMSVNSGSVPITPSTPYPPVETPAPVPPIPVGGGQNARPSPPPFTPPPPVPVHPPAAAKRRTSALLWVGLVGVIAILLVAFFTLSFRPSSPGPDPSPTPGAPTSAPPAPTALVDPLPQVFTAVNMGISLRYPKGWLSSPADASSSSPSIWVASANPSNLTTMPDDFGMLIVAPYLLNSTTLSGIPKDLDINSPVNVLKYLRDHPEQAASLIPAGVEYTSDIREVTLGGAAAASEEVKLKAGSLNASIPEMSAVFLYAHLEDRMVFVIGMATPANWAVILPTINQIVATIRFTPVIVPTAGPAGAVPAPTTSGATGKLKVGLVTDTGGVNDHSFNQYAWAGVQKAASEFGWDAKYIESRQPTDYEKNIDQFAVEKYDVILTVGFLMGDATASEARLYPNIKFAIIDNAYYPTKDSTACGSQFKDCYIDGGLKNVASLMFQEDEAGFLAGVLAAGMSKTGTICSVAGMEIPPVQRYVTGFQNGAKWIWPQTQTLNIYLPTFTDPLIGRENAQRMIAQGCDVVFGVGGNTGNGGLTAARDKGKMAVGVDVDQFVSFPDVQSTLLSSAVKNVDVAVYEYLKSIKHEVYRVGIVLSNLKNGGVGLAPFHTWESKIPSSVRAKLKEAADALSAGQITTGYKP